MVVSGGRKCTERKKCKAEFWKYLKQCGKARGAKDRSECLVIIGDARGVDAFIWELCKEKHIPYIRLEADWTKFGRRAGILRNQEMLEQDFAPTNAFFYFDGSSPGTTDMRARISKLGTPNLTVYYGDFFD